MPHFAFPVKGATIGVYIHIPMKPVKRFHEPEPAWTSSGTMEPRDGHLRLNVSATKLVGKSRPSLIFSIDLDDAEVAIDRVQHGVETNHGVL
jgi:hypothetical protein